MTICHTGSFLTAARREADLAELAGGAEVDVLVVGGGVTGAGAALDAATRGLSVALLESRDLANGTSRWSSKLVHGGLRYLAKGQFGVAWESARERATLAKVTAPHLVRALPMLTLRRSRAEAALLETGIRMGDGMRTLAGTSRRRLPSTRRVGVEEARRWAPALSGDDLRGAVLHWDGQLEDDARLVVALARTAAAHGARIVTYAEALEIGEGGARAQDARTGEAFDVRARHVINATGVWAGRLAPAVTLRPSKGAHIVLPAARLGDPRAALNVPVPGHFGRFVFALPRPDGLVLVGLTDEPYDGDVLDAPPVDAGEEAFLLDTLSTALDVPLGPEDVIGRYAGLRPLLAADGAETADLSRRHSVIEQDGVVTVVGGKLTTYRQMAQDAVDRITDRPCRTRAVPLVGANLKGSGLRSGHPARLVRRFGAEAADLGASEPLAPGVPALAAEVRAAIEREGALTVEDVLDRRLRLDLVPAWREAARPTVEAFLAERVA